MVTPLIGCELDAVAFSDRDLVHASGEVEAVGK